MLYTCMGSIKVIRYCSYAIQNAVFETSVDLLLFQRSLYSLTSEAVMVYLCVQLNTRISIFVWPIEAPLLPLPV